MKALNVAFCSFFSCLSSVRHTFAFLASQQKQRRFQIFIYHLFTYFCLSDWAALMTWRGHFVTVCQETIFCVTQLCSIICFWYNVISGLLGSLPRVENTVQRLVWGLMWNSNLAVRLWHCEMPIFLIKYQETTGLPCCCLVICSCHMHTKTDRWQTLKNAHTGLFTAWRRWLNAS